MSDETASLRATDTAEDRDAAALKRRQNAPAFPEGHSIFGGMTMRDYFAAQALNGMLAHTTRYRPQAGYAHWHDGIAAEAYEIADAMIIASQEAKIA